MKQVAQTAETFLSVCAAQDKAALPPVQQLFWKHLDYHREYCILLSKALFLLADGRTQEAGEAWKTFTYYICSQEDTFQKALDVYRVVEVSTNYTGFPLIENF